jgi:hypothetical protein
MILRVFKILSFEPTLHHANPLDKLSASLTRVNKYWIPKYVLGNPLGSKTRVFFVSVCIGMETRLENMSSTVLDVGGSENLMGSPNTRF